MTRVEWDESLNTGDAMIDAQHRRLFAMFNDLHDAAEADGGASAVEGTLDSLSEYVMVHFEAERRLMAETGFDAATTVSHLEQHDALTARTREMIMQYRDGELLSVMPLAIFLSDWLSHHIRQTDKALIAHVRHVGGR